MRRILNLFFLSVLVFGCKTVSVNQKPQMLTETPVELGSIGILNGTVIAQSYESIAIPTVTGKLKVRVQPVTFSKPTFKAFAKANSQTRKVALNYSDSLKVKPEYVHLQFVDRVSVTTILNNAKNTGLRSYLENKEAAQMVTSVSMAFPASDITLLKQAEEVFLVQSKSKKFSLLLKNSDGKTQTLTLSKAVVFAYQTSGFCWKENARHKLVIADLVSNSEGCPPNTHRKARKAVEENDYFKL